MVSRMSFEIPLTHRAVIRPSNFRDSTCSRLCLALVHPKKRKCTFILHCQSFRRSRPQRPSRDLAPGLGRTPGSGRERGRLQLNASARVLRSLPGRELLAQAVLDADRAQSLPTSLWLVTLAPYSKDLIGVQRSFCEDVLGTIRPWYVRAQGDPARSAPEMPALKSA